MCVDGELLCVCVFVCLSLILCMLWDGFGSLLNFGFGGARWTTRSFVMDFWARLLVRVRNFLPGTKGRRRRGRSEEQQLRMNRRSQRPCEPSWH
jgi:hypothetical protein